MTVKKPRNSLYKKGSKARANELKFVELKGRMAAPQQGADLYLTHLQKFIRGSHQLVMHRSEFAWS